MRRLAVLPFVLLATAAAPAQDVIALTPGQIGQIYCISIVGNDMAPVAGLLTPDLAAAIAEAEAKNAAYEAAHPGDKPPLGDGLPWQAGADYTPECSVGPESLMMDEATVRLDYAFPDYPAGNFSDTLWLKLVPGESGQKVWRIDNVRFADGDMRTDLTLAFMDN
jgi:hypothetical protein